MRAQLGIERVRDVPFDPSELLAHLNGSELLADQFVLGAQPKISRLLVDAEQGFKSTLRRSFERGTRVIFGDDVAVEIASLPLALRLAEG